MPGLLPVVNSREALRPPSGEAIKFCLEIISTQEAAEYFLTEFEKRVNECQMQEAAAPLVKEVQTYINYLTAENNSIWQGNTEIRSRFQDYQQRLAKLSMEQVQQADIKMDFSLGNGGEILRRYTDENGASLDEKTVSALDESLNAWLSQQSLQCQGGVVYQATSQGDIKKDSSGNSLIANVDALRKKIASNQREGFKAYLKQQKPSLTITINEQSYQPSPAQRATTAGG